MNTQYRKSLPGTALDYFDANSTATPGAKVCSDVVIPANGATQFSIPAVCTLEDNPHFGLLVASDTAGTNPIFGYARTQNNANAGFSVEGFPVANFATGTANAIGLRGSTNPAPAYQTNCFVASQADAVSYDLKLFDGAGTQIGSTVSGSLNAFEQVRYLDMFATAAAPAATDFENVRAEFTRTSAGTQQMVGFCTVQDNATFGADFRIAKAITPPPSPPPSNLVLTATWNGTIQTLLAGLVDMEFVGSTSVTLNASTTIAAYGGGWFAKQSVGLGSVDLGVCYQDQAGSGPITLMGTATNISVNGGEVWHDANGSATLAAGTYTVGLCALNLGVNSVNKNGHSSGFIFTTP